MSKTYMRKEKGDTSIKCVPLSDWGRYRASGYVFVETDEDGNTPEQQFVAQDLSPGQRENKPATKKKTKKKVSKKKN